MNVLLQEALVLLPQNRLKVVRRSAVEQLLVRDDHPFHVVWSLQPISTELLSLFDMLSLQRRLFQRTITAYERGGDFEIKLKSEPNRLVADRTAY